MDSKFSHSSFAALGKGSSASDRLADELQDAIAKELVGGVRALAECISNLLQDLGHETVEIDFELDEGRVGVTFADVREGSASIRSRFGSFCWLLSIQRESS